MNLADLMALGGVVGLALGLFWPRALYVGALLYLGAALADALAKGVFSGP
ncbi:cytochrome C assembly protein, partial [Thermus scotoductus]